MCLLKKNLIYNLSHLRVRYIYGLFHLVSSVLPFFGFLLLIIKQDNFLAGGTVYVKGFNI